MKQYTVETINKAKSWFFEKPNLIHKPPTRVIKGKKKHNPHFNVWSRCYSLFITASLAHKVPLVCLLL